MCPSQDLCSNPLCRRKLSFSALTTVPLITVCMNLKSQVLAIYEEYELKKTNKMQQLDVHY